MNGVYDECTSYNNVRIDMTKAYNKIKFATRAQKTNYAKHFHEDKHYNTTKIVRPCFSAIDISQQLKFGANTDMKAMTEKTRQKLTT